MIIDKPIVPTKHFKERAREYNIHFWQIMRDLPKALEVEKPKSKWNKHSSDKCKYYEYNGVIYTVVLTTDKFREDKEEIYLLLSVYDRKLDAPSYVINNQNVDPFQEPTYDC